MNDPGYLPYKPQLKPVLWADGIWTVEGPEVCYKLAGVPLPCPTRMTVVRLLDGKLWLHSPIEYSVRLERALRELGEIGAIVAPNTYHHLHVDRWARSFPAASIYASPDLAARRDRASRWEPLGSSPPASWGDQLAQALVDLDRFKEAVFLHRPTSTLIVTDLMQNFEAARVPNPFTRRLLRIGGATGPIGTTSIEIRIAAWRKRKVLRAAVRQMLEWQPTSIILGHGQPYRTEAVTELRRAFAWARV